MFPSYTVLDEPVCCLLLINIAMINVHKGGKGGPNARIQQP